MMPITAWDVVLGNGTTHRVVADRYMVSTKMYGGNLTFYRGNSVVAVYNNWLGFSVVNSTAEIK
jgi:hypothetical protein